MRLPTTRRGPLDQIGARQEQPLVTDPSTIPAELTVAAVCDALDALGFRAQAMHHRLRPLDPARSRFAGRARTVRWMEIDHLVEDDPYGLEIDVMDSLRPGDVVVHSTDHAGTNAPWGELMSTVAQVRGAVGTVVDSRIRDCERILALGFPVFHAGIKPVDSQGRGRVMAYDVPVRCGDVLVRPGELVLADIDGVVVVPASIEAAALALALDKVSKENASREELRTGALLRDVYARYGVL